MLKKRVGFTIVELLIVIVVIGILATIGIIAYNSSQQNARELKIKTDLASVKDEIEYYAAKHDGAYPITTANPKSNWKLADVRTDSNCTAGSSYTEWVPSLTLAKLPQRENDQGSGVGVDSTAGCYIYVSDGTEYVLSAWNLLPNPQTAEAYYRRLGFKTLETSASEQLFTCNEAVTGGVSGSYDVSNDYYKHSYTFSNITDCDETPPSGA